jgi:hypothetical protein
MIIVPVLAALHNFWRFAASGSHQARFSQKIENAICAYDGEFHDVRPGTIKQKPCHHHFANIISILSRCPEDISITRWDIAISGAIGGARISHHIDEVVQNGFLKDFMDAIPDSIALFQAQEMGATAQVFAAAYGGCLARMAQKQTITRNSDLLGQLGYMMRPQATWWPTAAQAAAASISTMLSDARTAELIDVDVKTLEAEAGLVELQASRRPAPLSHPQFLR